MLTYNQFMNEAKGVKSSNNRYKKNNKYIDITAPKAKLKSELLKRNVLKSNRFGDVTDDYSAMKRYGKIYNIELDNQKDYIHDERLLNQMVQMGLNTADKYAADNGDNLDKLLADALNNSLVADTQIELEVQFRSREFGYYLLPEDIDAYGVKFIKYLKGIISTGNKRSEKYRREFGF